MSKVYQYDASGYYAGIIEDYGGPLPNNATRTKAVVQDGFIPQWNGKEWLQVENHKGEQGYIAGEPHTIKEYGPYPEGWSSNEPEPTPPTQAEQIAAIQAPFIEEQKSIKGDFVTARIESDDTWEADLQAEYQKSQDEMAAATAELLGA